VLKVNEIYNYQEQIGGFNKKEHPSQSEEALFVIIIKIIVVRALGRREF
jgi:hypothetical protein